MKLMGKVLPKLKRELKQIMLISIIVRFQENLSSLDHLGGIIDNHESEIRFGDKNKIATLR
jgi:hypothetical protein